jgi:plasmid stabilization system protein ParE
VGYEVVLSRLAQADLAEIVAYIARDNRDAAVRLGHELVNHARTLQNFPRMGRVVPEFQIDTLREIVHGAYRIVYQIDDTGKRVAIARFWHGARGTPGVST